SEVGDLCQSSSGTVSTPLGSFTVQGIWDERSQGCKVFTSAAQDFNVSIAPNTASLAVGASGTFTVQTATVAGQAQSLALSVTAQSVSLSASGQPAGVTVTFSPASITAGASSTLTISASASAAPGTASITVTGAGVSATHTAAIALTITGGASGGLVNGGFEG